MAGLAARPLSFTRRFEQDLERIEAWYCKTADERVADGAIDAIVAQAERIARLGLVFRRGRKGTRECPLRRFPFLLVYRIDARSVQMLRAINARGAFLNARARA
ncbi:MAG: type II toxin-antitoxin system RelE/ParE family toxin [Betaproteobacteria bacterium]